MSSTEEAQVPGRLIYEYRPQVTQIVEFGLSADGLFSGRTLPPKEGARLDLYLEGPVTGPLKGRVNGVDYLCFRADGRADLHIHAVITTDAGKRVALLAGGLADRQADSSVFQLRENVTLTSNDPDLSWVNTVQVWAMGTVDVSNGQVHLKAYAV
jgi:hypothetical protein